MPQFEDSSVSVSHKLPKLTSQAALLEAARLAGSHFFDPDTMRYFSSKLADDFYPVDGSDGLAALFITSEQDRSPYREPANRAWGGARRFTVRLASLVPDKGTGGLVIDEAGLTPDGSDGHGAFASLKAARKHAQAAAKRGTPERLAMETGQTKRYKMNRWTVPAYLATPTPTKGA